MKTARTMARELRDAGDTYHDFQVTVAKAVRGRVPTDRVVDMIGALNKTMEDAHRAFDAGDFERVDLLIKVANFMIQRETGKLEADPSAWTARRLALLEAAAS
jgi:hypothetical protein